MDQKLWYIYTMEYYAAEIKKKGPIITLSDSMDGIEEHYAKWNKAGGERQIPYDLTYKWNLINKINKQGNQTRDIKIKNKLTVTRENRGGE